MSAEAAFIGEGRLRAKAGLGVVIRVTDGDSREFGSGIARLNLSLPAGLYAVGWTAAGSTAESVVRVVGGGETTVRPPWEDDRPDRPATANVFDLMSYGLSASVGSDFLISGHAGSTKSVDRSSLVVAVDERGNAAGFIPRCIQSVRAAAPNDIIEAVFQLGAGQCPANIATAPARWCYIVQKAPRRR